MSRTLNGIEFYRYLSHGADEVFRHKEELNRINVFPVADGDTGSNMAFTMRAMVEMAQVEESFYKTAKSISEAGILGARGNSGVLFAQFIYGLAQALKDKETVAVNEFISAVEISSVKLQGVLSAPQEGTIISVIRDWVQWLTERVGHVSSFESLFLDSMPTVEKALFQTTEKMEILKINQVVDSGAKGFVLFLKGIVRYIKGDLDQPIEPVTVKSSTTNQHSHLHEGSLENPYCYECVLRNAQLSIEDLRLKIKKLGDSLIIAGEGDFIHIHLHTKEPHKLTSVLNEVGQVTRPKVENMALQSELRKLTVKKPMAIVTDSIADISEAFRKKYPIYVIPLRIQIGEREYLDRETITAHEFYEALGHTEHYPTSSLPSEVLITEKLNWLAQHYESVLVISVSQALSGTYDAFLRSVKELQKQGLRIALFNSRLNSGAQGLLVIKACEWLAEGLSMDEILRKMDAMAGQIEIYVALNSFEQASRSGRIPRIVGKIGSGLNLKPIVSLDTDGNGVAFSIGWTRKQLLKKIYKLIEEKNRHSGIEDFVVVHSGDEAAAILVGKEVEKIIGKPPLFVSEISSITALHAGVKAVAVAFLRKSKGGYNRG